MRRMRIKGDDAALVLGEPGYGSVGSDAFARRSFLGGLTCTRAEDGTGTAREHGKRQKAKQLSRLRGACCRIPSVVISVS